MNIPCKELKRVARMNLVHNYITPMGALLIAGLIPAVIGLPFSMAGGEHPDLLQIITLYIAEFLISLLAYVLNAGVIRLHLAIARNQEYPLRMVFHGFQNHPDRFILAGFAEAILLLAAMLPCICGAAVLYFYETTIGACILFGGLTILSIALAVIVVLNLSLVPYLLLDQPQLKVPEAITRSQRLMHGQKRRLLYIYLSFIGWECLNLFTIGIGTLWIAPYISQTLANFYRSINGETLVPAPQTGNTNKPTPSFNQYV